MLAVLQSGDGKAKASALFQYRLLQALVLAKRYHEAVCLGSERQPGQPGPGAWDGLVVESLHQLGRYDEALARIDAVLACGEDPILRCERVRLLLAADRRQEAIASLDQLQPGIKAILSGPALELALEVWSRRHLLDFIDQSGPPVRHIGQVAEARLRCLAALGRSDDVLAMVDPGRHVIESYPSSTQDPQFLAALCREVSALGSLVDDPEGYTTRGGQQSSRILENAPPAMMDLLEQCRREVERYAAMLSAHDPVALSRPQNPSIEAWAVVLRKGGHQLPHYHPNGWLSGVFYVAVPTVRAQSGALRIGLPPPTGETMPWDEQNVMPEPGKLVLFPSMLRHATDDNKTNAHRISIAFDVVP